MESSSPSPSPDQGLFTIEGCTNQSVTKGVCIRHSAIKTRRSPNKRCSHPGCSNPSRNKGVCRRHGAKTYEKKCKEGGCTNRGVKGGLCRRHYSASVRRESGGDSEAERCVAIDKQQQNSEEPNKYTTTTASNAPPTNRDYTSPTSMAHSNGMTYAAMMNLINVQAQFIAEKDLYIVQLQNTIGHLLARDGNVNGNNAGRNNANGNNANGNSANGNNATVAEQPDLLEL